MQSVKQLATKVFPTQDELGAAAAEDIAARLRRGIKERGAARLMLAAAPSQLSTLRNLATLEVDFSRITCFHMDEYIGLEPGAPQGFGNWIERNFISLLKGRPTFHRIGSAMSPTEAADEYSRTLGGEPFDVTVCGLGVNAHLAFNDPPADFEDQTPVRVVELSDESRQQQVDEGHFADLADVPTQAVTVTIKRLLDARRVVCCVPGRAKRDAVAATLRGGLDPAVPGTALKLHPDVTMYLDVESASTSP